MAQKNTPNLANEEGGIFILRCRSAEMGKGLGTR